MEITSVNDVITIIQKLKKRILIQKSKDNFVKYLDRRNFIYGIWYRGELDFEKNGLTPGIFRKKSDDSYYCETTICSYLPTINEELRKQNDLLDKVCYMQHYDVPTRLLDWTDNILVALYFAVKTLDKNSKIYALNARSLNNFTSLRKPPMNIHDCNDFGTKFRINMSISDSIDEWKIRTSQINEEFDWLDSNLNETPLKKIFYYEKSEVKDNPEKQVNIFSTPIAIRPNIINSRQLLQSGLFTLHGGKLYSNSTIGIHRKLSDPKSLIELNNQSEEKFIEEYIIPQKYKEQIQYDLLNLRIHEGSLFPELDKQSQFVKLIS